MTEITEIHLKDLTNNRKRITINHCLLTLGAPKDEVYVNDNKYPKKYAEENTGSIYTRHSKGELLAWAKYLYLHAMKRYHPDGHLFNKDFFTMQSQILGEAYSNAKRILTN